MGNDMSTDSESKNDKRNRNSRKKKPINQANTASANYSHHRSNWEYTPEETIARNLVQSMSNAADQFVFVNNDPTLRFGSNQTRTTSTSNKAANLNWMQTPVPTAPPNFVSPVSNSTNQFVNHAASQRFGSDLMSATSIATEAANLDKMKISPSPVSSVSNFTNPFITDVPSQRSNSNTRAKNEEDNNLLCPVCGNKLGVVVYLCEGGHSACETCHDVKAVCGKAHCRRPIGDVRNRALEAFIGEMVEPCPNSADGCCLHFKVADMDLHKRECPFEIMNCPLESIFKNCNWRGKIRALKSHFELVHPAHVQANVDKELSLFNICDDSLIVHLVDIGNFVFLVNIKVSANERVIKFAVQLIGTKHSARKWTYEINVYNKREPRRKYQYIDACQSNAISPCELFDDATCAALPLSYAMSFVNEGSMTYKFFIKKGMESENKKEFNKQYQHGKGGRRYYNKNNV